jgi:hypothetical protein
LIPKWSIAVVLLLAVLIVPCVGVSGYSPHAGDNFTYYEVADLGDGTGDYFGYTEQTITTGTESINGISADGVVAAHYAFAWNFDNSTGSTETGSSSGDFTFSSVTCHYLNGTDGQTGYVNPTVWFFVNSSTLASGTFFLLNTEMTVTSWNSSYYLPSQGRSVEAIQAQGSSAYQRNDVYGIFDATYTWTAYFDPNTGYIIGYSYTENDVGSFGSGFTYTENLYVNSTSYPLTTAQTPPPDNGGSSSALILYAAITLLIVVAIVLLVYALSKRRRTIPQHPSQGLPPTYRELGSSPKDIEFNPKQPPVQQIVIHEVVKVKCRYCGALIDSTAAVCPQCGAPRT